MEHFRASFALSDANLEAGTFRGTASVFNTMIDTWCPTIIDPGAFADTLADAEQRARVKILLQHDWDCPIGLPLDLKETTVGLDVLAKISATEDGKDALTLVRDGVLTDLSIGFDPLDEYNVSPPGAQPGAEPVRHLRKVKLWEISLVTWGANGPAKIYAVNRRQQSLRHPWNAIHHGIAALRERYSGRVLNAKNLDKVKTCIGHLQGMVDDHDAACARLIADAAAAASGQQGRPISFFPADPAAPVSDAHGACPSHDPPIATTSDAWDGTAAELRVRKWASSDGSGDKDTIDWAKYRKAFAWYDANAADSFSSYKLIHCDVINGALQLVERGVIAAGNAVQGARGGVAIPEADMTGVKTHLTHDYERFDRDAPWEQDDETEEERLAAEQRNRLALMDFDLALAARHGGGQHGVTGTACRAA